MGKGENTRETILALAEDAVLSKGFAATSIEELIVAAGITKSGFFYHFKDKSELAKNMLQRFLASDAQVFDEVMEQSDALTDDPLQAYLVMLKLTATMLENMETQHPGCLVAAITYQSQLFNSEIKQLNAQGVLNWREMFIVRLQEVAKKYPPREPVDLEELADMASTIVEGGIVMSKALDDKSILPRQILLYRDYIKRIFEPRIA